jgi:Zn-dependent protease with chaperone function
VKRQFDFFEQQERARRASRWLILWYLLALAFAVASYCAAAAALYALCAAFAGWSSKWMPWQGFALVGGGVGTLMLALSLRMWWRLREGGHSVAWWLGARYVDPEACNPAERRLLNVVEEMAIASGIAVPPVYLLPYESGINALVAGYSPNEAVIVVTRGTDKLSRDELQGVMAHEFSHILNGDMALNVRLVALLSGLTWIAEEGESWVYRAAMQARDLPREERGLSAVGALFGAAVACIGFPATLAADAIKAAISRQREFLADAASVQFTRNPDGIAGALDSILALRAHTAVSAAHAGSLSHMFFAPAVPRWWSFPTHPPIDRRIRRAHPRFQRDEYRAVRHGERLHFAVIDGAGNVVRHQRLEAPGAAGAAVAAAVSSVGRPQAAHVDYARRLLDSLPSRLREALRHPAEAEAAMLALVAPRPGTPDAPLLADLRVYAGGLARQHQMTLAELAVPAIKEQPQAARDRFLAELAAHVEADGRVTLQEFVLLVYLRQRLREGAGQPIATRFRRVEEVADDAHVVVSLLAAGGDRAAFQNAAAVLKLGWSGPLAVGTLGTARVGEALERLRHLAPFAKPAVLKACVEAAAADGVFRLAEVELLRMVAATLDCPIPPLISALDPRSLL